jgi:hypothetical protein
MIAENRDAGALASLMPVVLGPSDVREMLRVAEQTRPGPFGPRTH